MIKNIDVGDKIGSEFIVLDIYGGEDKTGFGVVYICLSLRFSTIIALKTFQDKYIDTEEVENFKREALAWITLEIHPNIITAAFNIIEGRPFIIMEPVLPYKGKKSLKDYIETEVNESQILDWGIQFCHGMEYAFIRDVSPHRDIKPSNLMIRGDKLLKITDFGLAKLSHVKTITDKDKKDNTLLKSKSGLEIIGTSPYMAPETFSGKSDQRSDIYSFGVTLFQLVNNGKYPFKPKDTEDWATVHLKSKIPRIESDIFPIIKKCLEKDPNKRYQNFNELRNDLEEIYIKKTDKTPYSPKKLELSAEARSDKGYGLEKLGLWDYAVKEYKEATQMDPESFMLRMNLGRTLKNFGSSYKAIKELKKAVRINPNNARAHWNLGDAYSDINNFKMAEKHYKIALRLNKNFKEVYINYGNLLRDIGKVDEAINYYEKALEIDSEFFLTNMNIGIAFAYKLNYDTAIEYFKKAEMINKESVILYGVWGLILSLKGNYKEAFYQYIKALTLYPENSQMHKLIANTFMSKGKPDQAIYECDQAIKYDSENYEAYGLKGNILKDLKRYDDAIKCVDKAIEINPNYTNAWNLKGIIFAEQKIIDKAIKCFDKALKINSEDVMTLLNMGVLFLESKKPEKALKMFDKVTKLDQDLSEGWWRKGEAIAFIAKTDDERRNAIKYLDKALEKKSKLIPPILLKGSLLADLGEAEEAFNCFNTILKIDPENIEALLIKGLLLESQGKIKESKKIFDEITRINPNYFNELSGGC